LTGCSIKHFLEYVESKFEHGMTWNNYGKGLKRWGVDHIKPCASFDLSKPEEQKTCFNYKNLRPMWNKDNFSKSSWYNGKLYRLNCKD